MQRSVTIHIKKNAPALLTRGAGVFFRRILCEEITSP